MAQIIIHGRMPRDTKQKPLSEQIDCPWRVSQQSTSIEYDDTLMARVRQWVARQLSQKSSDQSPEP